MDPAYESENSLGRTLFALGLGSYIAFLPLNWLSLGSAGGLEVRLSHVAAVFLALAFFAVRWRGSLSIMQHAVLLRFSFVFICYLLILWSSSFTGEFHGQGIALIAKQVISFVIMLIIVELVMDAPMDERSLARLIYFSSAIGIVLFVAVAVFVFASQGKNLFVEYLGAVLKGDLQMLRHGVYKTLFAAQMNSDDVNVSFKNGLLGAFCAIHFMVLTFSVPALGSSGSRLMWMLKWFCLLACGFIVLTSISRSNMLVMLIGSALGLVPQVRGVSAKVLFLPVLLLPIAIIGLVFAADKVLEASGDLLARFESLGQDARFTMFEKTLEAIGRSPSWLTGAGVGSKIDFGINELQVHNLFLASWYEAGIPALVCSLAFYSTLVYVWSQLVLRYRYEWWPFECEPVWMASLLTLPLIRMMVGGQGGNMSVNDWFAVAMVLAVYGAAKEQFDPDASFEDDDESADGDDWEDVDSDEVHMDEDGMDEDGLAKMRSAQVGDESKEKHA